MDYRIFVSKKAGFDLESKRLLSDLQENLKIKNLKDLKILNVYDIFGIDDKTFEKAKKLIFSEIVTDDVFDDFNFDDKIYFAYESRPGQFDLASDSAMQCLNIISDTAKDTIVKTGKVLIFDGDIDDETLNKIKSYIINPVENIEKDLAFLEIPKYNEAKNVEIIENFIDLDKLKLQKLIKDMGLAMNINDLVFIQDYFKKEKRNPFVTEIMVLDTYWSDHCRHTTFETFLQNIIFPKSDFGNILQNTFNEYLEMRKEINDKKNISLMDMATIGAKYLRKKGKLDDLEISNEINACSIYIDVEVDGKIEKYLLMFKNETHNHPTEIEPFGGAATCLGGAIRDPLSGRAYVYQAIRVSGAGNILEDINKTLNNKLPQKNITLGALSGYSSYGNQIGLTTNHVAEIYDEGYKAKRMEVGAVVGAVPASWVVREEPKCGDIIILLGGKTGRDGIGGAVGSSKKHDSNSLHDCGSEVQKGNAPEERKILRFFRNEEVCKMIKKCNDFGAGGVSVAIGELAPSLEIDLDLVPTKYQGLNGTELAISESQERMAVVIEKDSYDKFIKLANKENLSAVCVAKVTDTGRLIIKWKGQKIVDLSREFLDTNGMPCYQDVKIEDIDLKNNPFTNTKFNDFYEMLEDMNIASNKGMMERFDSSIGSSSVFMPFGGKYELTPTDVSIQKIPVIKGKTNTASAITWGYNPRIARFSSYHAGIYAVIESISKLVSVGCSYNDIYLSFQEYFEKLGTNPSLWGKPMSALLGTIHAQKRLGIASIGGKDSMSGSFNEIHVPPTLISFAVSTIDSNIAISPEFKRANNRLYLIKHNMINDFMPNFDELIENYEFMHEKIKNKEIISAYTLKQGGLAEAIAKMSFGNKIGARLHNIKDFYKLDYGSFVVESCVELNYPNAIEIGRTIEEFKLYVDDEIFDLNKGLSLWLNKLALIFPYEYKEKIITYDTKPYINKDIIICKNKIAKPKVLIPVFPGTNCEYDTSRAFLDAGAKTHIEVFRNQNLMDINESIDKLAQEIKTSQILMLSGGFSAGDEPDGSGKFIANILTNEKIAESIMKFLENDGLILGICNGFQALIKSGLLPYGELGKITKNSPTLAFNKIGRHVSQMVTTKIVSNLSPWLANYEVGEEFVIPVSHGEGRFVVNDEVAKTLFDNGQIATQYVNEIGLPTNEFKYNPNGSDFAIEGITSPDGHIFGKMGHSERYTENTFKNIKGNKKQDIFSNGVNYFKD